MKSTSLQNALSAAERLPQSIQDQLGRDLMERIERVCLLHDDIEQATQSLDEGEFRTPQ